jgi:hypothetical protein
MYLRGPFLTLPLGTNFVPQGRSCPQGWILSPRGGVIPEVKLSVCSSILLNIRECSTLGVNEGVNISPRIQRSHLVAKCTPREHISPLGANHVVKNWPQACKSDEERARKFYTEVQRRGPQAFESLVQALANSGNADAVKILEPRFYPEMATPPSDRKEWDPHKKIFLCLSFNNYSNKA